MCRVREELARGRKKTRERWCPVTGNLSLRKEEALFNCEADSQARVSGKTIVFLLNKLPSNFP